MSTATTEEIASTPRNAKVGPILHALGVGFDKCVALCFLKTNWMVVAILAILKAGGAAVSIGSSYLPSRLSGLIANVSASAVWGTNDEAGRRQASET